MAGTLEVCPDSGGCRSEYPVWAEGRSVMTDKHKLRVELEVPIPEGATPGEEQRLLDQAVEGETKRYIEGRIDAIPNSFGKLA